MLKDNYVPVLLVIIATTRPARIGPVIARWAQREAEAHGGFDIKVADLAAIGLPFFDEPSLPRFGKYEHEHTRAWARTVEAADAVLIVTPEYNYGPVPSLVNALDFLYWEWAYKPVGFVSYGGLGAGLRGVQALKGIVTTMRMAPVGDNVGLPFAASQIEEGEFNAQPAQTAALNTHLDELQRWTTALAVLRAQVPALRAQVLPRQPTPETERE